MKKSTKIYVDTSVIGGCFDPEFEKWSNSLFKDFEIGLFVPVISEIVAVEIALAPEEVVFKYSELLNFDPVILELSDEVID